MTMSTTLKEILDLVSPSRPCKIDRLVDEINEKAEEAVGNLKINAKPLRALNITQEKENSIKLN